jgi:putative DNA primase/helicase
MGEYATTAAPGLITGAGLNRHPTEIAHLRGMRMVTSHESGEASVLREEFIKQQTGSDPLTARRMREDFFTFIPTHKLQLLTNHKPAIKGQDEGLWRRVLLLPYAARFGAAEDVAAGAATGVRDMALPAKLKEREELEGVLAWAVRGAVEWQAKGLQPPWAVREAVKAYQGESDRVAQFVAECCEVGEGLSAPLTHPMGGGIYQEYVSWCNESGLQPISKVRLLSELSRVLLKENIVLRTTDKKEGARKVGEKDERRAIKVIFGITGLTCNG